MRKAMHPLAGALASVVAAAAPALAEPLIWGLDAEQFEFRVGDETDVLVWDFDAIVGSDELKFVWRSEGEYAFDEDAFEMLENQARLQAPVSTFFNAVVGVRVDTPDDGPDRVHGVFGLNGLAPQWIEIDADLFVSDNPFVRLEGEYEALITNRITLVPNVELEIPFTDDRAISVGAWGPKLEVGARLRYDLVDRAVSPYIGVHYERTFGDTADLRRRAGKDEDAVFFVVGTRLLF